MSKAPDARAQSRSRSRSRSRSYSRSRSRSHSRSRSRKRRYSSRSRSRSRSHTPSYRNYPSRDYQNNRGGGFRGYNRGYRRPFHYRPRNRGYYNRGHYQNRGGGGYNHKSNWQGGGGGGGGGGGWHERHHDQDHHSHSPRRGRSRSRTPKKRSGSRSRSHYSERSSSGRSQRSKHSSESSRSRSSSPRHRSNKSKRGPKEAKDKLAESPPEKPGHAADGSAIEKASGGKWIDYDASPKRANLKKEDALSGSETKGPSSSGGPLWKTIGSETPPPKSPSKSEQTASFGGFGFFSNEEAKSGDKTVISAAFKKFLAENKNKQAAERENGREKEQSSEDRDLEKGSKPGDLFSMSSSFAKEDKTQPFFDAGEEEFLKSHGLKDQDIDEDGENKPTLTARDIFGKWGDEPTYTTSYPSVKEKTRRDEEEVEPIDHMEEDMYRSRKHSSKKEEKSKKKEKKEKTRRSPSPATSTSREKERPLFPGAFPPREDSPVRLSCSREEFELKFGSSDELPSSSASKDRLVPRDLLNVSKKDPEFRSTFQHIQAAQLRRSPSELFAQHIVSIVHYIKAQHFHSSDMTLSERFAMYQRKAAEVEMMKPRKSPEIHRRIDVSPSAFKRHSHLFEDMEEASYKDPTKKFKGDVMDLRLDIERRKKFAVKGARSPGDSRGPSREKSSEKSGKHHKKSKKGKKKRDRSPSSSSSSSSPSPYPSHFRGKPYMGEGMEQSEEGYPHPRYPPRDCGGPGDRGPREYEGHAPDRGRGRGFFPRVRGRGWNRGNYPGNNGNGNPANMNPPVRPPEEEWDPEYTPKSRKYYLHDDRDGEKTWIDNRGRGRGSFPARRGRFVYRKGGSSPKWTHDMFQGEEGRDMGDDGIEVDHKDVKGGGGGGGDHGGERDPPGPKQ
ncbi:thyroid hormone receptor-associated protein 3b isoform X3 [Limanda limanda]|uniref:thyroid hormone receptor-associated protein 3b isoform X3 n=1 Tax=Limanda limanda TaxID=27771 RepID=UPI0029C777CF|nr:thyroid hormone receptor-associated protein 3b isoform X3 [Limanda limanda]